SSREGAGFVFTHHLRIEAHGLLTYGETVTDVNAAELVAWVLFFQLAVVFADQRIPDGGCIFWPPFSSEHDGSREANVQAVNGPESEAHANEFGVRYRSVTFILTGEQGELPRADPAQPLAFRGVGAVSVYPGGGQRPGVVRQDQAGLPTGAPPTINGTGTQY